MRLPVTSSRRCEQITAFGASDVPDVKISAQIASTSGSRPGSSLGIAASASSSDAPSVGGGIVGVGEARRRRGPAAAASAIGASSASWRGSVITSPQCVCSMSRSRCSLAPGVVQPDDRGAEQRGAAEREEVVGRVVEQHGDVARAVRAAAASRNSAAKRHDSAKYSRVRPRPVAELDRDARRRARRRCGAAARPRSARRAVPGRARGPSESANLTSASVYERRGAQSPEHRDGGDLLLGELVPVERGQPVATGARARAAHASGSR